MKHLIVLLVLLPVLFLFACESNSPPMIEYDGREITESELRDILERSLETDPLESVEVTAWTDGDVLTEDCVFFTDGGEVYHVKPDCRYISGKSTVYFGTKENAVEAGKKRACSSCFQTDSIQKG